MLMAFTMIKWKPPARRPLALADKGRLAKMFEPWNSRADLENTTFNNMTLSNWYNKLIDAMQRLHIPQELLNCNTKNIAFSMNPHHTFVWPRHANREDFHSRMMSFYLDEKAFDKEVMSWLRVKCNLHKSRIHYIFPIELLKKKGKEAWVGLSSGPKAPKKEAPTQTESKEEETQLLERKKRIPSIFPQLLDKSMLIGNDVNEILSTAFIR
jgi:hypothetical protein